MITLNKSVQIITKMLQSKDVDISLLMSCLKRENPIVVIPLIIKKGSSIIRVRPNIGNERFYETKELTYAPAKKCNIGRANLKRQSMFYGVLPSQTPPRIIALKETIDNLFNPEIGSEIYVTFSKWTLKYDVRVFAFPFSKHYQYFTNDAENIKLYWRCFKSKLYRNQAQFSKYIGELMSVKGNESLYSITANTIQYIINNDKLMYKGVVYPSQKMSGLGNNIALTKKTVDNCCRLNAAVTSVIIESNGEPVIKDLETAEWDRNGKITWNPMNKN